MNNRFRVLPVVLALGGYLVLAVVGHVLGYLYRRHSFGDLHLIDLFVGRQLSPFPGGFTGDLRARFLVAWVLGLLVALAVVAVFVLLSTRSGGPFAVFTGGWLGSILGTAAGSMLAVAVFLPALFPQGTGRFPQQRGIQYLTSLQHGLYWGAVAGLVVGLAALLGMLGGSGRRTPVDSSPVTPR